MKISCRKRCCLRLVLGFHLGHDFLLLLDVKAGGGLLRLLELLAGLLNLRPLRPDVLLGRGRRCQCELLLRILDRRLSLGDLFILRAGQHLIELGLIGLELLLSGDQLALQLVSLHFDVADRGVKLGPGAFHGRLG